MKNSQPESAAPAGDPTAAQVAVGSARAEQLLKRLEWTVIRKLDGLLQGDYRTLFRGAGLDLADLREYQMHDDVRHIDWNVTARQQIPHVRVFTEDREMSAWFLLDLSPSIDFGSGDQRKQSVSTDFVGVLSRMLTRHGNKVGAVLYGGTDNAKDGKAVATHLPANAVLPARGGRNHVLHLIDRLIKFPVSQNNGATRLQDLLGSAGNLLKRRSTVFVLSDFISEPGWEKPLAMLARRHEVLAVRLLDPLELELPNLGLITIRDAETGEQLLVDTSDGAFRRRFASIAAQREAQLRESLAKAGVDTLELSTDDDLVDTLMRFADLRKRRSRVSAGGSAMPMHLEHSS